MSEPYTKEHPHREYYPYWTLKVLGNGSDLSEVDGDRSKQFQDYLIGSKNPRWRNQIKEGLCATTSLTGERTVLNLDSFSSACFYTFPDGSPVGSTHVAEVYHTDTPRPAFGFDPPPASSLVKADNAAKLKFAKALEKHRTTVQGAVILGEGMQTIRQIMNPAKALREGVGNYLKRRKASARQIRNLPVHRKRDILANSWLEAVFGWRPLLSDLDEAAKAAAYHFNNYERPKWKHLRASGVDEGVHSRHSLISSDAGAGVHHEDVYSYKTTVTYIGQVGAENHIVGIDNLARIGMNPASLLPAIWEVIPWSFMIDYFTNIGDIVSAAAVGRSGLRWSQRTVRSESIWTSHGTKPYTPDPGTFVGSPRSYRLHRSRGVQSSVDRSAYEGYFIPNLSFSIPGMGTKWLNMAALYVGRRNINRDYLS